VKFTCAHCEKVGDKPTGEITRARNAGLNLYCDRRCSGLGRRGGKTEAERVEEKRLYDIEYRAQNRAMLKAKKRAYHVRTYDPAEAAIKRKKNMPRHVAYCRRPEYKAKKVVYDRKHRAEKWFGPFAEAAMLATDLNREIKQRMTNHEIKWQNQTSNKSQFRRRATREAAEKTRERKRGRDRRDRHQATLS
jgi:hypothetical protein